MLFVSSWPVWAARGRHGCPIEGVHATVGSDLAEKDFKFNFAPKPFKYERAGTVTEGNLKAFLKLLRMVGSATVVNHGAGAYQR